MGVLNEIGQPKYLTRTPLPSVDWSGFFAAVNEAFILHLASQGPPGQKAPVFVATYPKDNLGNFKSDFDVILFDNNGCVRAATDPSGGRRYPKGPNPRETKPHPTKDRYSIVTLGWWEMMDAQFQIVSLSHDRANELVDWFHWMMMQYTGLGFFKDRGVHYLTFESRGPEEFSRAFGQEMYTRKLNYNVRLELLQNFEVKDLESVHFQTDTGPDFTVSEQYPI